MGWGSVDDGSYYLLGLTDAALMQISFVQAIADNT
jgi:hypothetical protein